MRKKSHISLAWYLMNSEGMDALKLHKVPFTLACIAGLHAVISGTQTYNRGFL